MYVQHTISCCAYIAYIHGICVRDRERESVCVCMFVCLCVCTSVCISLKIDTPQMHVRGVLYVHVFINTCLRIFMYAHIHEYSVTCMVCV